MCNWMQSFPSSCLFQALDCLEVSLQGTVTKRMTFVFCRHVTDVVSCFPHFWEKCLAPKQLKEMGLFWNIVSLRVQFIKVGKAGGRDLEAAGHVASAASEQIERERKAVPNFLSVSHLSSTSPYLQSSHLDSHDLESSSQTHPEVCFNGHSKCHQIYNQDKLPHKSLQI